MNNYSQTRKSRKGLGLLAVAGVCVVAIATFMGAYEAPRNAISDEAAMSHLSSLIDHH